MGNYQEKVIKKKLRYGKLLRNYQEKTIKKKLSNQDLGSQRNPSPPLGTSVAADGFLPGALTLV